MIDKTFIVSSKLGLHARPAAMFVKTTTRYTSSIRIIRGGQEVDGKSLLGILMLAAEKGTGIRVIINGDDEKQMFDELADLFYRKFDEI